MKLRAALSALVLLVVAGCSGAPTSGTVYAAHHFPGHWSRWTTSECIAYISTSRTRLMVVNGRSTRITYTARNCAAHAFIPHQRWIWDTYELCLDDSGRRGCRDVSADAWATHPVGSLYGR